MSLLQMAVASQSRKGLYLAKSPTIYFTKAELERFEQFVAPAIEENIHRVIGEHGHPDENDEKLCAVCNCTNASYLAHRQGVESVFSPYSTQQDPPQRPAPKPANSGAAVANGPPKKPSVITSSSWLHSSNVKDLTAASSIRPSTAPPQAGPRRSSAIPPPPPPSSTTAAWNARVIGAVAAAASATRSSLANGPRPLSPIRQSGYDIGSPNASSTQRPDTDYVELSDFSSSAAGDLSPSSTLALPLLSPTTLATSFAAPTAAACTNVTPACRPDPVMTASVVNQGLIKKRRRLLEDQNANAAKRINGSPATSSMPTVVTKANLINQQRRSASPALVKLEAAVNDDNDYDIDDDDNNDNNADNLADREPIPMVDLSEDSPRICYSQPRI